MNTSLENSPTDSRNSLSSPDAHTSALPEAPPDSPTESWLLAWALTRAGFPTVVSLGSQPAASPNSPSAAPQFALHLKYALPIPDLLRALLSLRANAAGGRRAPSAILLTSHRAGPTPYREHLHLDDNRFITAIRRHFPKRLRHARPSFVGIAWKISPNTLPAPLPKSPWHTLLAIFRHSRQGIIRRVFRLDTALLPCSSHGAPPDSLLPYFVGPRNDHRPVYDFAKRIFDIAFSLFALLITLPICVPIALLIKLYDRGPIFFAHRRETLHGRPFPCLKFRTMVTNAEALKLKLREKNQVDGPQFKIAADPRVTPLGRFLRKTNIDELPQFLNVLFGQMSVVGPRPSPFEENQLCPAWREARLSVKPGITGLWQISRSKTRGPTDFQEWIFFDTQYVERRNFLLDIRILLLTVKELLGNGQ